MEVGENAFTAYNYNKFGVGRARSLEQISGGIPTFSRHRRVGDGGRGSRIQWAGGRVACKQL